MNASVKKSGFTLVELLIVILIIGLLSAISIPMYKKAVEKSRVTDALTTMQAVAKSEHSWYLNNNDYTKDFANLDIALIDENGEKAEGESYDTVNYTFTLQDNAIKAERTNNEYTLYKMYEDNNIYCLPREHYICEQFNWGMNRNACENMGALWSNMKNNCYNNEQERCVANEMTYNTSTGVCGCNSTRQNGCENITINEGGQCVGNGQYSCKGSTITAGGECVGRGAYYACQDITVIGGTCTGNYVESCSYSTFTSDGICDTTGAASANVCAGNNFDNSTCKGEQYRACNGGNFKDNSSCIGNSHTNCEYATFNNSTCEGNYNGACSSGVFENGSICKANAQGACSKVSDGGQSHFKTGSKCIGNGEYACAYSTFEAGTTCEGNAFGACGWHYGTTTFESGSKCIANAEYACGRGVTYKSGSICVANAQNTCGNTYGSTYESGSCCQNKAGYNYCPASAPKCNCPNGDGTYATSC